MTIGGKPAPVYVVTDAQIASGEFSIAPGKAVVVSALDISNRGVSGGHSIPVYPVDLAEANRRGIQGGLNAAPVVDTTSTRLVAGFQEAIPVYVTHGSLGGGTPTQTCYLTPQATNGNYIKLLGVGDRVVFPVSSEIDDVLAKNLAMTVEIWVYTAYDSKYLFYRTPITKSSAEFVGWQMFTYPDNDAPYDETAGAKQYGNTTALSNTYPYGSWNHISFVVDLTKGTYGQHRVNIDGVLGPIVNFLNTTTYPLTSDAGVPIYLGTLPANGVANFFVGWARVSKTARYWDSNFTPPDRLIVPAIDDDTVFIVGNHEGTGTPVACIVTDTLTSTLESFASWGTDSDVIQPIADTAVSTNLAMYISFDTETPYDDESGNGNRFINTENAPSMVAGKYGKAVSLDTDYVLKLDTNSFIETGDVSWTMSMLVKHTGSLSGPFDSLSYMGDPTGGGTEWLLYYDSATPKTEFIIYNGTTTQVATATINGALSANTWYWMAWGHDADTGQAFLHVNQASSYVNETGTPGTNANADLFLGRASPLHSSFKDWDGEIDEVYFVREALTVAQLTALRNSNEGLSWIGYKNYFYGFSDANLKVEESWRGSGVGSDLDTTWPGTWTQVTGLRDDIRYQAGAFYPATVLSGYSGFYYDRIMENDQYASLTITDTSSWDADKWMGIMVRCSTSAETFYAFLVEASNWKLIKVVGGAAESVLDASIGFTPVAGTRYDLKAEGTTISVDANGVLLASATDLDIASGRVGVINAGLDLDVKLSDFRCGDLPIGNLMVPKLGWAYNVDENADGVTITADCGAGFTGATLFNQGLTDSPITENEDHIHYAEIDFGEYRQIGGFRSYASGASLTYQYDSVTLKAKLDSSDAWSTMFSTTDMSDPTPETGFIPDNNGIRFTPFVARYVRVEIISTEDINNYIAAMEWEFHG